MHNCFVAAYHRAGITDLRFHDLRHTATSRLAEKLPNLEDTERNLLIQKHLKAGLSSWNEIMSLVGCSRGTVAKQAALLRAASISGT